MSKSLETEIRTVLEQSEYGLTQRELAEKTGYSRPTIRKIVEQDADIQILRKAGSHIHLWRPQK